MSLTQLSTKMPLEGLPYVLEIVLREYLETDTLQSWNIHGKDECTFVTMRFQVQPQTNNNGNTCVRFKKVKPSHTTR